MGNNFMRISKDKKEYKTSTGYCQVITDKDTLERLLRKYENDLEIYNYVENKQEELLLEIEKNKKIVNLFKQLIELM